MTRARKNVLLLTIAQGLAMTGMIINSTTAALAGHALAADKSLATLPIAFQFLATMLSTIPASIVMARIGRRPGFLIGSAIQLAGALLATLAMMRGDFWMFTVAGALFGVANGVSLYYRFAAADTADEAFRAKAISLVMGGGVAAALAGPEFARWSRDLLLPHAFAGTFLALAVMSVLNLGVLSFLDIPKPPRQRFAGGRPFGELARQPQFVAAVLSGMLAYGAMSLLMTATPLAMQSCGWSFDDSAFVIQWHALGMFAPAFFTGHLIRRFGVVTIMQSGAALLVVGIAIDLSGQAVAHFWSGLILLGVGWNFLFVGATTMLTQTYGPAEKGKVQALNDFCIFSTTALSSFSAGKLQYVFGWETINWVVLPLILAALVGLTWLRRLAPRPAIA